VGVSKWGVYEKFPGENLENRNLRQTIPALYKPSGNRQDTRSNKPSNHYHKKNMISEDNVDAMLMAIKKGSRSAQKEEMPPGK